VTRKLLLLQMLVEWWLVLDLSGGHREASDRRAALRGRSAWVGRRRWITPAKVLLMDVQGSFWRGTEWEGNPDRPVQVHEAMHQKMQTKRVSTKSACLWPLTPMLIMQVLAGVTLLLQV